MTNGSPDSPHRTLTATIVVKQASSDGNQTHQLLKLLTGYADSQRTQAVIKFMALETTRNVRYFIQSQVLRDDYLIIDEPQITGYAHCRSLKEHRLQQLCLSEGYLSMEECQQIAQRLTMQTIPEPVDQQTLTLLQAYLPECVCRLDGALHKQPELSGLSSSLTISHLSVGSHRYKLSLPMSLHALLIEKTGALLAA